MQKSVRQSKSELTRRKEHTFSGGSRTLGTTDLVTAVTPLAVQWYHPKHVEQFPCKINCVTLHLVGHILE